MINPHYTPEVREFLFTRNWPERLLWDVYDKNGVLVILLYKDNLATFNDAENIQLKSVLLNDILKLNESGVPIGFKVKDNYE